MKNFVLLCCIIATAVAFPAPQDQFPTPDVQSKVKNVIDVPVVCPPNQKPDHNGRCREVWRLARIVKDIVCAEGQTPNLLALRCDPIDETIDTDMTNKNVIDAPIVCPAGQKPDQNGKCRDQWLMSIEPGKPEEKNVIDVPVVCPVGQKPDQNGKCRETWTLNDVDDRNVIDAPVVCPVGQKPDQNGKCRDVYSARSGIDSTRSGIDTQNVIDVPVVCPPNQKPDQNGKCRDVYARSGVDPQNVIDVPVVCPPNQKPDQNGKCREQWSLRKMQVPALTLD